LSQGVSWWVREVTSGPEPSVAAMKPDSMDVVVFVVKSKAHARCSPPATALRSRRNCGRPINQK
jgi:hypothetical protein